MPHAQSPLGYFPRPSYVTNYGTEYPTLALARDDRLIGSEYVGLSRLLYQKGKLFSLSKQHAVNVARWCWDGDWIDHDSCQRQKIETTEHS